MQISAHLGSVAWPVVYVQCHRSHQGGGSVGRHCFVQLASGTERIGLTVHDGVSASQRVGRSDSRQQMIESRSERIEVAALVSACALHLLQRGIVWGITEQAATSRPSHLSGSALGET